MRKLICAMIGHKLVFNQITLPRRWYCSTCGKRFGL